MSDHEAQRQAADSQTTDQGARDVVARMLHEPHRDLRSCTVRTHQVHAERILSALAEAGYTVVKTEWLRELENAVLLQQVRPGALGPWAPVRLKRVGSEGSADNDIGSALKAARTADRKYDMWRSEDGADEQ